MGVISQKVVVNSSYAKANTKGNFPSLKIRASNPRMQQHETRPTVTPQQTHRGNTRT
jgi:hypothetical protein